MQMSRRDFLAKTADQFDQLLLNAVLRIFRCTLMILAIDSEALPLLLYTVFAESNTVQTNIFPIIVYENSW